MQYFLKKENKVEKCTVVSLVPSEIPIEFPGVYPGMYKVPKSNGKTPTTLVVGDAIYYMYVGAGRGQFGEYKDQIKIPVPSTQIADSIVKDYLDKQLSRVQNEIEPALFWVVGEHTETTAKLKFKDEMAAALDRQTKWLKALVTDADDEWEQSRQHKFITNTQRQAARILGLDRAWLLEVEEGKPISSRCGVCRQVIMSDAIVCPYCKAILDAEKYKAIKFAS